MATETTGNIELSIFLKNGSTFLFDRITVKTATTEILEFYYFSRSTGKQKKARFYIADMVGYSVGESGDRDSYT